jgi:hypothetical protein
MLLYTPSVSLAQLDFGVSILLGRTIVISVFRSLLSLDDQL